MPNLRVRVRRLFPGRWEWTVLNASKHSGVPYIYARGTMPTQGEALAMGRAELAVVQVRVDQALTTATVSGKVPGV